MKASISKTFCIGHGDGATDVRIECDTDNGGITIRTIWGEVDGEPVPAGSRETISFDDAEHLDFVIEALCKLSEWADDQKKEKP